MFVVNAYILYDMRNSFINKHSLATDGTVQFPYGNSVCLTEKIYILFL